MPGILNSIIRAIVSQHNDTARAVLISRAHAASRCSYDIYVDTYKTPAGRVFTKTVKVRR